MTFSLRSLTQLSRRSRYIIAAIILVGVALGYLLFGGSGSAPATLAVTQGDFTKNVSVSGSVIAAQEVDLGFASAGRISGTYASVGQHIGAWAVLAQIENGDLVASVMQKQAALASLRAGTRPEGVAVTEAAQASTQTALVSAIQGAYVAADDAVHNRADVLFTNPNATPQLIYAHYAGLKETLEKERAAISLMLTDWQISLATLTPASSQDRAAKAQADLAYIEIFLDNANVALNQALPDQASAATIAADESLVSTGRSNVAAADAAIAADLSALVSAQKSLTLTTAGPTSGELASAQAELENAQAALAKSRVVAPFNGVVTRMDAKAGEIVSPSTSEIAMQSDGLFQVEVYIPEVSIAGVAPGERATTTLDAYGPSAPFAATVVAVDPAETMKNGVPTYKTTLTFTSADPRIRSGMTANVSITTGVLHNAIVIPEGAVGHSASGAYVSLLVGKKLEHRSVETGSSPALGQVEVVSGLAPGDVIALTP